MPQTFDETYAPRPWACDECKRVLGVVMRVIVPGSGDGPHKVRRLWVFRVDVDAYDLPAVSILRHPPRGLFKVHGVDQCHGVECSHCGAINKWSMNQESFLRLMGRYRR